MGKKKNQKIEWNTEKDLKSMQKDVFTTYVMEGIVLCIITSYIISMFCAYKEVHPRAAFGDSLLESIKLVGSNPLYFWPIEASTIGYILLFNIFIVLFIFLQYSYQKFKIHNDPTKLKGDSKWGDVREFTDRMADWVDDKHKQLGFYNSIFSDKLRMSMNYKVHAHTMNTLVLGTTGTGKSYTIIKPNILQMNTCYVVTDPKGELLLATGETLRRFGYNVRVFDLIAMGNCNAYNPMKYCYQESDINKLVQAFIKNTDPNGGKGGSNADPFWDNAMNAFLCACISLLVTYCDPEKPQVDALGPFDRHKLICNIEGKSYVEFLPNFSTLCELTRMANRTEKNASKDAMKNNTANASELNTIFEHIRERFKDTPEKPYCLRMWDNFKIAPEKTSTTILMTAAVRLAPFNIEEVKNLTSIDTIDLNTFSEGKDALFVLTKVGDPTYNFLVSFLYTQLFDILYTKGTRECEGSMDLLLPDGDLVRHYSKDQVSSGFAKEDVEAIKKATYQKIEGETFEAKIKGSNGKVRKQKVDDSYYEIYDANNKLISRRPTKDLAEKYIADLKHVKERKGKGTRIPCHVRFLLDEFCNICEIPDFKEKLSTMRGYEISCVVICQTITQLKGKYPDDYEVVDANCPEVVFLGGTENTNNEYISKKIGTKTVIGVNNSGDGKKLSSNYNTDGVELIKPEQLGRMPPRHCITIIDGENPVKDKTFNLVKHPMYQYSHDYMSDIGIGGAVSEETGLVTVPGAMIFSRARLIEEVERRAANMKLVEPIVPVAVPSVEDFTDEVFMKLMQAPTIEKAMEKFQNTDYDYMNSIVNDSEESAF